MKIIRNGTPNFKFGLFELKDLENKRPSLFFSLNCKPIKDNWCVVINEDKLSLFINKVEKPINEYGFVSLLDGGIDTVEGLLINHGWISSSENFATFDDIPQNSESSFSEGEC